MISFWGILLGTIVGNFLWGFFQEHRNYRYKWTCPVCKTFKASASSKLIIESIKAGHTHS